MEKKRNIGVCIILSIISCGIYSLYWLACLTDEVNTHANEPSPSGALVVLFSILTCGIYYIYWSYIMGERIEKIRIKTGCESRSYTSIIYTALCILYLHIITMCLIQHELNQIQSNHE